MRFSVILSLVASTLALQQGTPVKRDGASINSAIATVSQSVAALAGQVAAFQTADDIPNLQASSDAVVSAIEAGTATAQASAPLSSEEAFSLAVPIQNLATLVNTTVQAVIDKKPTFVAAGAGPAILQALQTQLTDSRAFAAAVIAKLPDGFVSAGQQLSAPIITALQNGVNAYSDQGGSTSTTTTGGSTTSGGSGPTGTPYGSGWESWGAYTTTESTTTTYGWSAYVTSTTSAAATWSNYGSDDTTTAVTWSNYSPYPVEESSTWETYVVKTYVSTWDNVEVTYTVTPTWSETSVEVTSTWVEATVKPSAASSQWVDASVKSYAPSPSSLVKTWTGAAAPSAVASFGVSVMAAIAAVIAVL